MEREKAPFHLQVCAFFEQLNCRNPTDRMEKQLRRGKSGMEDVSRYAHSPAHLAVARRDYLGLRRIIKALPRLPKAGEVATEAESLGAERTADAVSAVIDRRDVPGRETPLHLAVRLRDPISAEILMSAGADWSLQNEQGWSALQEAVFTREDTIAMIITRHYRPLAWAKWCRRLPRILSSISRIRDFYMEITFHFESSAIPFIGRIAPSDTYRIWKRGANLRADMTLAGFDGFRIQRSDQTILFLGEGIHSNGSLPPGSLIVLEHKEKDITDALEGAGARPTEAEVAREVAIMSHANMYRAGIDVTQAELVPCSNWRGRERREMVGDWKAKVCEMLNVMVSVKSRRVPGSLTDGELHDEGMNCVDQDNEEMNGVLTSEERTLLNVALQMNNDEPNGVSKQKKCWFGCNKKKASESIGDEDSEDPKVLKKFSKLAPEHTSQNPELVKEATEISKGKEKSSAKTKKHCGAGESNKLENEYKKWLRPVLWLSEDFPLKTDEVLPLLDILANKVKAVRRLRELLATKLPQGTFPVKVAIPIVPTIRVIVTFTKFRELQQPDELATPLPSFTHFEDGKSKESEMSNSWYSWVRGSRCNKSNECNNEGRNGNNKIDPFHIPSDYTWVNSEERKRRMWTKKVESQRDTSKRQASEVQERRN